MAKPLRLGSIVMMSAEDWIIVNDLYANTSKAEWCELFFHLYQEWAGQCAPTFIVDDVRERLEVIASHHDAMMRGVNVEQDTKE